MPFTPFHLGPGAALKAVCGRHFSFMVFGGTQVLMDIEPLIGIIEGKSVLHGYSHTIVGATIIGSAAGIIGRPISIYVLKLLRIKHHAFSWLASFSGSLIGSFSHIALDAIMHSDMNPFWPLVQGNNLLGLITNSSLHVLCLGLGVFGGIVMARRAAFNAKS
jgi:hypothetical protein